MEKLFPILETLTRHDVEFIVVGGVSAVLNGVPVLTFDLDIVHNRTEPNVVRLFDALVELDAFYRFPRERRLCPSASTLMSKGHQLLITKSGNLDVLGEIGKNSTYADLLPHTEAYTIGIDTEVRVLDLETLAQMKEEANRDKDRVHLATIRETLKLRDKQ